MKNVSSSDIIYPNGRADIDENEHGYILLPRKQGTIRDVLMTTRPSLMTNDLFVQRVQWNDFKAHIGNSGDIFIEYDESNPLDEYGSWYDAYKDIFIKMVISIQRAWRTKQKNNTKRN